MVSVLLEYIFNNDIMLMLLATYYVYAGIIGMYLIIIIGYYVFVI